MQSLKESVNSANTGAAPGLLRVPPPFYHEALDVSRAASSAVKEARLADCLATTHVPLLTPFTITPPRAAAGPDIHRYAQTHTHTHTQ